MVYYHSYAQISVWFLDNWQKMLWGTQNCLKFHFKCVVYACSQSCFPVALYSTFHLLSTIHSTHLTENKSIYRKGAFCWSCWGVWSLSSCTMMKKTYGPYGVKPEGHLVLKLASHKGRNLLLFFTLRYMEVASHHYGYYYQWTYSPWMYNHLHLCHHVTLRLTS